MTHVYVQLCLLECENCRYVKKVRWRIPPSALFCNWERVGGKVKDVIMSCYDYE